MNRRTLPQPDDVGIYTFPQDLVQAHLAHQEALAARRDKGESSIIKVTAPYLQYTYLIEERRPQGRPVVAIEPHHDDLALSASGSFLARPRPLTVVTVFTNTNSADRTVRARRFDRTLISQLRAQESRQALRPLRACHHLLGHTDAVPPYGPYSRGDLDRVTADLEEILAGRGDAEILAPAAVTRHPDHLLVHEAAKRLGCRWFWEDVAFWQTYALSVDDLHLFYERTASVLSGELTDISDVVLDKLTLLYLHSSQLQPLHAMYRPIRYAWTTGSGLRAQKPSALYAERFYRSVTS
ncbi:hypothetical protein Sru01_34180 [Sphaerisporangium rufum]|uniref:PIG-L family deacetylase n=1 Tax=Sphaerisporangium rufum TaxID=1381558 RepID=A0A919R4V9_9ACTN|nr:PIG-L family deacetylase [Sphaerisporangium rufum]GII78436.1 hypothetical protein Sru01_34180 [Sphaerisporangium rufum]